MITAASQTEFTQAILKVRQASQALVKAGSDQQSHLLDTFALELDRAKDAILEANTLDLEASLEMAVPDLVLDWLKLTPERLQTTVHILRRLASMGDARSLLGQSSNRVTPAVSGFSQVMPLGVIALVYEAIPELTAIAAGLCLRTGNGLVLKGGNEASQTNQAIAHLLHRSLEKAGFDPDCILALSADQGDAARAWLMQADGIDLIIPYGRPILVQQIMRQATVPVLPTAMGNCYLYWAASGDLDKTLRMIQESHQGEPDAVNSIEKVLIHESHSSAAIQQLCRHLWEQGFRLRGEAALGEYLPDLTLMEPSEWRQPYLKRTIALAQVNNLSTAVDLINQNSSGHADCLVTESYQESYEFMQTVQSAAVYINASPRFSRNPSQGAAIALGMTAQRGRCSGFIGLGALMTTKHVIQGI